MKPKKYIVIDIEPGITREDLHTVESRATTESGFLQLFYRRWPHAIRGWHSAVLTLNGADIYTRGGRKTAQFIERPSL